MLHSSKWQLKRVINLSYPELLVLVTSGPYILILMRWDGNEIQATISKFRHYIQESEYIGLFLLFYHSMKVPSNSRKWQPTGRGRTSCTVGIWTFGAWMGMGMCARGIWTMGAGSMGIMMTSSTLWWVQDWEPTTTSSSGQRGRCSMSNFLILYQQYK